MQRSKQIALAFPRGAHQELFIEGALRYAAQNERPWTYTVAPESLALSVVDLIDWPGDGVLAALNTPAEAACACALPMPVVNISSALEESPTPRSMVDNLAIGALAAEHLLSKGFRNFAFYGLKDVEYSKARWLGFAGRLEESGASSHQMLSTATFGFSGKVWVRQHRELAAWLSELPLPCGVLAVSDYRARHVLDACRQAELKTPEQIAVIGVDNEQVICEHVSPTLSSVARNDRLEGYRAAELLDRLMRGEEATGPRSGVPPLGVVERESTAAFAVSDPRLRKALAYLHENIEDPITVEELADHAEVSRRWLEYEFRSVLGETPYQYVRRQRLIRAKRLLSDEPDAKIYQIAQRTGFSSVKQLTVAFQQAFGATPGEFRKLLD